MSTLVRPFSLSAVCLRRRLPLYALTDRCGRSRYQRALRNKGISRQAEVSMLMLGGFQRHVAEEQAAKELAARQVSARLGMSDP